ncbi:MAG: hypothetical protein GY755_23180 [Chloroflexi bacterium]|nr:hypothetical protein [Chloroflexota bacterium]
MLFARLQSYAFLGESHHTRGKTVVTIPGATKAHQVEQSAGAMKLELSENELNRLNELSAEFL